MTLIGAIFVWRKNRNAIFFNAIVAGFADTGYFLFLDLGDFVLAPGPQMTYICASAIILSFYVYFKSDKLPNKSGQADMLASKNKGLYA